jgi:GR25 family glycosyltransferase involved in LPS biosynthesis
MKIDLLDSSYISFCNLDERLDRLQHMNTELNRVGINAVRQRSFPWKETDYKNPKYRVMYERTPGAIGCHLSQVEVMKTALELGLNAIVLEDDIKFCSDFHERMEYISNWSEAHEWDIVWLGAAFHINPPHWHRKGESMMRPNCSANLGYDVKRTDDPRMIRTYGCYNTFAYLVNYKSLDKIIKLLDHHVHESIGIDWLFIKLQPQLKCFSFVPGCVYQIDNQSNIGQGMTVWSGHLNNGPYVWKNLMSEFDPDAFNWHEAS